MAYLRASLVKAEGSAQMDVARVVRAKYSGPKTDSLLVFARELADAAPGASWEYRNDPD